MELTERARIAREIRRANSGQLDAAGELLLAAFIADDNGNEAELRGKLNGVGIKKAGVEQRRESGDQTSRVASVQGTPKAGN